MGFFRYYFKYNIFDIASLIVQYAYAVSVLIEFLNIEHKDPYKENIVVRPVPSSGRYKITYTFSLENEIVFSFNLYTKYIFTIIDFVNVELVGVNNKSPNEIIDIFNGTKRSTSRSSNFDRSSALNIYKYILGLWDSLESYFSLKDMAKNGLDIRNLNFLSKGIDEFQKIVTELSKTLGDQFIKVTHTSNLKKKTNISSPSFSNFKCTMNIEFLSDNNGGMSMDSTDVMDDAANVDISLNEGMKYLFNNMNYNI